MKSASHLRLLIVLLFLGVAGLAWAKTDTGANGPVPVLYTHTARFSRLYDPSLKPEHLAKPGVLAPVVYPPKWKQWGKPAYALVAFLVDASGNPQEVQCIEATDRAFAKVAEKAVDKSVFFPALKSQQGACSKLVRRFDFTPEASNWTMDAPASPVTPAKP